MSIVIPKTALISLSDKTNLETIVSYLIKKKVKIISTGGTFKAIKKITNEVLEVSEFTGFEEMMDGRVKTLHPKIHAGILARRDQDMEVLKQKDFEAIDLVIVNLYPFQETIKDGCSFEEAIEKIDIGGPTMIRAAAKNFNDVVVLSNPDDYEKVMKEWDDNDGISYDCRKYLSQKVFATMANYNKSISQYLNGLDSGIHDYDFEKAISLRYGENPHQNAKLYTFQGLEHKNIANADIIQGKELSYNNIVDADAALECVKEFEEPACVIVKHANPCGVATSKSIYNAYDLAFKTDPTSAFGGVIAFNKNVDLKTAKEMNKRQFIEVVIAPGFDDGAIEEFANKKNIRILKIDMAEDNPYPGTLKKISGGILVQDDDNGNISIEDLRCVTERKPSEAELKDMMFAWKVAKFVKSNAIVYVKNKQTIGIGAGQMSRVISAEIANLKAAFLLEMV